MQKDKTTSNDIYRYVLERALEEHKFSSTSEVAKEFSISKISSRDFLNSLVRDGKLSIVYENPQIKVYAPKEVIEEIARVKKKPKWVEKYALPNKEQHLTQKEKFDKLLYEYERFEELLYLKHKALEEPTIFTFEWLGFKVERLPDGAFADFELEKDAFQAAVEVAGGNAGCSIAEVRQLNDYYDKTLTEEKREIPNLLLMFNHFSDTDLKERKAPFAPEIIKAAERYKIILATTVQLYEKVKRVKSGTPKATIVKEIMEGNWGT